MQSFAMHISMEHDLLSGAQILGLLAVLCPIEQQL